MRIAFAFRAFFAALSGRPLPSPALGEGNPSPSSSTEASDSHLMQAVAAQTLGLLQAEGRLLDFLSEDISDYSDAEVGQVVREVHRGCNKALEDHFELEPVRPEAEEDAIHIGEDFDPGEIRVVGRVVDSPPFSGTLKHAGYRAKAVRLPRIRTGPSALVVSAAEVEV